MFKHLKCKFCGEIKEGAEKIIDHSREEHGLNLKRTDKVVPNIFIKYSILEKYFRSFSAVFVGKERRRAQPFSITLIIFMKGWRQWRK